MEIAKLIPTEVPEIEKKIQEGKIMGIGIKHARLCYDLLEMQMRHAIAITNLQKLGRIPTPEEVEKEMTPCIEQEERVATTYTVEHVVEVRAAFKLFVEFYDGKRGMSVRTN